MARCTLEVQPPCSREITILVLRRVATYIVEQWDGGTYTRALDVPDGASTVTVRQLDEHTLEVGADGRPEDAIPSLRSRACEPLRMTGAV